MRIPKASRIEKACSTTRQMRPVLEQPYLRIPEDRSKATLEATDSYKLARIPVDVERDDTEGHVSVEAVKASRKAFDGLVTANGSLGVAGVTYPRPDLGTFPNTGQLIPDWHDDASAFTVGIDAKKLYELAQAIGADRVTLRFAPDDGARKVIYVQPLDGVDGADGLMMPIRVG